VIRLCIAGATGWAGSSLARAVAGADDIELVAAVGRTSAGSRLGDLLDEKRLDVPIFATPDEALARPCDVFVEYTRPDVAKGHVLTALAKGAHVVIGTSGLTDQDYREIDGAARAAGRGTLAVGNFAITMVLLQKFAEIAAQHLPSWEIVDYASDAKADAPSGTGRELAHRLSLVRRPHHTVPVDRTDGPRETRGADLGGTQVHSVRLPGYNHSVEVIFGAAGQRLVLRHDAGGAAEPYVEGALVAIRAMGSFVGLKRGLDQVMTL